MAACRPRSRRSCFATHWAKCSIFFIRSRHLAIHVDSEEDLLEYRRRLDGSAWPVEMQIQHETIESIYTHDPNGYMVEFTRANETVWLGLTRPQWFLVPSLALLAWHLTRRARTGAYAPLRPRWEPA